MQRILLLFCVLAPLFSFAADNAAPSGVIRLATTTSVDNSGLLKHLLPRFLEQHTYEIDLKVVGSGKALRMGRTGDVDIVWVHFPPAEKQFVDDGYGINHQTVMRNDYIVAGPADDPGNIVSAGNIIEAFQRIARNQHLFVSRGDDSGTNKKEISLWKQAGIDPYGTEWYMESGVGMAASLEMAQKKVAYVLIDHATFVVGHEEGFTLLLEDPINLSNFYSVIAVNPDKNSGVNLDGANDFIEWLISPTGQETIAAYSHKGQQLYKPTRLPMRKSP